MVSLFYRLLITYFKKYLFNYFKYFIVKNGLIKIFTNYKFYYLIFYFLSKSTFFQIKNLVDLVAIDYPGKSYRFLLSYLFLSNHFNNRLNVYFCINELFPVISVKEIFNSSNWLEREVWDFFGIFFLFNNDLRRLFSDYGFEGYAHRKDFPLFGYYELYYNQSSFSLCYGPVSINKD